MVPGTSKVSCNKMAGMGIGEESHLDPSGRGGSEESGASPAKGADRVQGDGLFERERPRLVGLAYRMLGTRADAEDVVQDAWLRWQGVDQPSLERPAAWLTTVTTRLALDRLRASRRRRDRERYVGPWLPEPIVGYPSPESTAEMADSLTLGFLTMLDRLSPLERAVFLLADVFVVPFKDIAPAVNRTEPACRQIASRARRRLRSQPLQSARHLDREQRQVVDSLIAALGAGDVEGAIAMVAPDVVLVSDGGATKRAARHPVVGADRVVRLLTNLIRRLGPRVTLHQATVNGDPGFVAYLDEQLDQVVAFQVSGEASAQLPSDRPRVHAIWIIRNPEKLTGITRPLAIT